MDEHKTVDEKELTSFVTEQLTKCKRDDVELQSYLNISYFLGKQWVKVDKSSNQIFEPPREPWQVVLHVGGTLARAGLFERRAAGLLEGGRDGAGEARRACVRVRAIAG